MAGLSDAVIALRAELTEAMETAKGQALQFEVGTVTMEFEVVATADAEAKGGVRFWVVELGSSGNVGRSATNKVTMELRPRTSNGKSPLISDDD